MTDQSRIDFEAWAATKGMGMHLARSESGLYVSRVTQNYMDCWMASRGAVVVELPSDQCIDIHGYSPKAAKLYCRKAIESAGLQVKP